MKVSNVTRRRRLLVSLAVLCLLFAAIIVRLAYVQLGKGAELSAKAEENWRRQIPSVAKRGEIQDRNGVPLAYNISSPTIMAVLGSGQRSGQNGKAACAFARDDGGKDQKLGHKKIDECETSTRRTQNYDGACSENS